MSREADKKEREEIANKKGVRWSALDELPGWMPAKNSPLEFMHATFLGKPHSQSIRVDNHTISAGEIKHVVQEIILGGGMLTSRGRHDKPKDKFNAFMRSVEWPGSMGRVPGEIGEGTLKADQWRNLASVLVVALFCAWHINGQIPNRDAPRPKSSTKAAEAEARKEGLLAERRLQDMANDPNVAIEDVEEEKELNASQARMSRNYNDHYRCVLDHCTAIRIYGTRAISPSEVTRASEHHSRACRSWARMKCHLTPNFHLSEHNATSILAYGPVYGYWGYPMEQHNGFLKKFRHNGHPGGELEATLMRGWIKYSLVNDLVSDLSHYTCGFNISSYRLPISNASRTLQRTTDQ